MAQFLKIGSRLINLDHISEIEPFRDPESAVGAVIRTTGWDGSDEDGQNLPDRKINTYLTPDQLALAIDRAGSLRIIDPYELLGDEL